MDIVLFAVNVVPKTVDDVGAYILERFHEVSMMPAYVKNGLKIIHLSF